MKKLTARDIMITQPLTIPPAESVARAMLEMTVHGIGGLPVVEKGELLGMITHRDLILAGGSAEELRVMDIMSTRIVALAPETPVKKIAEIMRDTGLQRLPVVEGKRLMGLVTQSCLIRMLAETLE